MISCQCFMSNNFGQLFEQYADKQDICGLYVLISQHMQNSKSGDQRYHVLKKHPLGFVNISNTLLAQVVSQVKLNAVFYQIYHSLQTQMLTVFSGCPFGSVFYVLEYLSLSNSKCWTGYCGSDTLCPLDGHLMLRTSRFSHSLHFPYNW